MWIWYALGALVLVVAGWVFAIAPARYKHSALNVLDGAYIAHRGLHDLNNGIPENSLSAFRNAVKAGLAVEIDIHITADGELVVFHDNNLQRMCGVDVEIAAATLEQLKAYRLKKSTQTIPTLQECLDVVAGQVPLLIEFKCLDRTTCRRLCEAADKVLRQYEGEYLVQSFYPFVLSWYRKHRPDVCRGQLAVCSEKGVSRWLLGRMAFNWISRPHFISYEYQNARRLNFRAAVALGAYPIGWTFHSQQEALAYHKNYRTYIFELFCPHT